jgi:hypothetical protein
MGNRYGNCPRCGKLDCRVYGIAPDLWCSKCNQTRKVLSPCACGCGELTRNTFISGHNARLFTSEEQSRRGKENIKVDWSTIRPIKTAKYKKVAGRHEHVVVAELKLGRALRKGEIVHHTDHDSHNNHPDNLEVMTQSEHCKAHNFGKKKHD